jgi:hypothetical protein
MYLRIEIILNGVPPTGGPPIKLTQSLLALTRRLFTFQPELRSGYYTPMLLRPFKEHH